MALVGTLWRAGDGSACSCVVVGAGVHWVLVRIRRSGRLTSHLALHIARGLCAHERNVQYFMMLFEEVREAVENWVLQNA